MNAARSLRLLLLVLGACCTLIGLLHVLLGPAVIPGALPANATMDSEDRFFGVLFAAYGAACLWCAASLLERLNVTTLLAAVFFLGGLSRVVSIVDAGLPHPFFIAMTSIEIVLPPVLAWQVVLTRRALMLRAGTLLLLEHGPRPEAAARQRREGDAVAKS